MLKRLFNGKNQNAKVLKKFLSLVDNINAMEAEIASLSDDALRGKTQEFKDEMAQGKTLDQLLIPAFAVVREASRRVLKMRHFDEQLIGGIALHQGMIAEMRTGEGKTLVATAPAYLNALAGKGVHVVTVNDYLAQRDSSHTRKLYEFLNLSVGCVIQDLHSWQRKEAYEADITYGTNNEFGFDYLRDNMKFDMKEKVQRLPFFAIVDEVDSILIDEARTPLIISGPADDASNLYGIIHEVILQLEEGDYEKDEKNKSIAFTDRGYEKVEDLVKKNNVIEGDQLFQPENMLVVHHLNQALKAEKMFHRDIDYIVKDGKVVLIDEFTGRMMKGRRFSDGLHQALEAKERVEVEVENQTLASITFQNYFRMYPKLSGMTGTAATEAAEFLEIYKLAVLEIPTHKPVARKDYDDEIFRTFDQKVQKIVAQVKECTQRQQPILVGTSSIEKSEIFEKAFKKAGISCNVLNARQHEKEAGIIAKAGIPGTVTIATNMAGRGTDIKLGGNLEAQLAALLTGEETDEEKAQLEANLQQDIEKQAEIARKAGGLFVLGTERHESRRIDNQLRGRSGRQGDPGMSKFFISLEDDLMRIFGPNLKLMEYSLKGSGEKDDEPIMHPWLSRAIEKAQQRVEAQHFDMRKHLLKYEHVLNAQRVEVYAVRDQLMAMEDSQPIIEGFVAETLKQFLDSYMGQNSWNGCEQKPLREALKKVMNVDLDSWIEEIFKQNNVQDMSRALFAQELEKHLVHTYKVIEEQVGQEAMRSQVKRTLLHLLDQIWIGHLNAVAHLRSGIHLQAYGQKDPLNEYKHQAFIMFQSMTSRWHQDVLRSIFYQDLSHKEDFEGGDSLRLSHQDLNFLHQNFESSEVPFEDHSPDLLEAFLKHVEKEKQKTDLEKEQNVSFIPSAPSKKNISFQEINPPASRKDFCPCGSGERYKNCHGKPVS